MNKELTPLEVSKQLKDFVLEFVKNGLDRRFIRGSFDIIETALKNYEEGLYHAETYVKHTSKQALFDLLGLALKNVDRRYWKLPEQLYDDVNKSLKALEIIKSKEMLSVFKDIGSGGKCYLAFNTTAIEIPQEEFELLKEVLL